jgi:hypothetical protein
MAEVTIRNARVTLSADQILSAIEQLSGEERDRIRRELGREEWRQGLQQLLDGIRARLDDSPVSEEEIAKEVRAVRAARRAR